MKITIKSLFRESVVSVILALVLLSAILSVFAPGFASEINIRNMLKATSVTTLTGLAQLSVLSVGQFNLAIGSMGCLSTMVMAWLMQNAGVNPFLGMAICIVVGMLLGLIQGLLVAKTRLNPFIITLALDSIYVGAATVMFSGQLLNNIPMEIKYINRGVIAGVPMLFIVMLVVVAILYILINKTTFGHRLLLAGESEKAASIAGIQPKIQYIIAHAMSGTLAAVAGILAVSRLGAAQLSVGNDWMMLSFAAPVLGGTLMSGGKVAVVGTIIGALLMTIINYGLVLLNVDFYWTQSFLGIILVACFALDFLHQRLAVNMKA